MKEYQVTVYQEGALSSLIFGSAKVDPKRLSNFLNKEAQAGWRVVTMERESRRMFLFFEREAFVIVMERDKA